MKLLANTLLTTNKGVMTLEECMKEENCFISYYCPELKKKRIKTKWNPIKLGVVTSYFEVIFKKGKVESSNYFLSESLVLCKDGTYAQLADVYADLKNDKKFMRYTGFPLLNIKRKEAKYNQYFDRKKSGYKDVIWDMAGTICLPEINCYEIKEIPNLLHGGFVIQC